MFIGCKLPNGIVLDHDRLEWLNKDSGGSAPVVRVIRGKSVPVTLKGYARKITEPDQSVYGYGVTEISAAFWADWVKLDAAPSLLDDRILIAAPSREALTKMARELELERGAYAPLIENDERTRALGMATADEAPNKPN